jgi:hypothetical protein
MISTIRIKIKVNIPLNQKISKISTAKSKYGVLSFTSEVLDSYSPQMWLYIIQNYNHPSALYKGTSKK